MSLLVGLLLVACIGCEEKVQDSAVEDSAQAE